MLGQERSAERPRLRLPLDVGADEECAELVSNGSLHNLINLSLCIPRERAYRRRGIRVGWRYDGRHVDQLYAHERSRDTTVLMRPRLLFGYKGERGMTHIAAPNIFDHIGARLRRINVIPEPNLVSLEAQGTGCRRAKQHQRLVLETRDDTRPPHST